MDPKTTDELDRLLADGGLSGPEADAIFDRVYASVEARERSPRRTRAVLWLGGGALVGAAAAALLFMRPAPVLQPAQPAAGAFAARGTALPTVALQARCVDGTLQACPASSKLAFVVAGEHAGGYLSAYAEPLAAGGERVWYFSREADNAPLVGTIEGTSVFERAVKLGGTHRAGRYRIHAFLAERPLSQSEMLSSNSQLIRSSAEIEFEVIGDR